MNLLETEPDPPRSPRPRSARLVGSLVVLAFASALALATSGCDERIDVSAAAAAESDLARPQSLVAMARLEPSSRVVRVGSASNDVVRQILVAEGDEVVEGQVLVLLDSYTLRGAELEAARLKLERAQLQPFEVEAQRARMRAIAAELEYAREEVGSQKGLSEKGFSAGKEFRDAQLRVLRAEEQLNESKAVLEQLEASASLQEREARNQVFQAEARLEQTMVRSPLDGQVLRITMKEGERTSPTAVVSLGSTQNMYAVGEIHANDIRQVVEGQRARFTSAALPGPLEGRVETIGAMIHTNYIAGEDPSSPLGLRVVEVRVRLEENALARQLTHLEGQLRIFLNGREAR